MQGEIDNAAGMIWRHLHEHGETTLGKLKQQTKLSDQLVSMGIGWLAREDKLSITKEGENCESGSQNNVNVRADVPTAEATVREIIAGAGGRA